MKAFLFAPLRVELYQVAGYIFNLGLGAVLQFLPRAGSQLVETGSFAFFAFVFGNLVQRVDGDKDHVVILIDQTHHFLRSVSVGNTYQSRKTPNAVVSVHHVISGGKLVQLLQAQSHLATAGFIAFQVVFMETVEKLVVGKDAETQRIVGKTLVQGTFNGCEGDIISPVFKNSADTVGLLQTVAAYIEGIVTRKIVAETLCHQVEILMEDRLCNGAERNCCIRRSGGLRTEFHAAEIEGTQSKLSSINQLTFQRDCTVFFGFAGCNSLCGKRFIVDGLNTFPQPKEIAHRQQSIRPQKTQERNHSTIPPLLQATAQIGNNDNLLFLLSGKLALHFKSTDTLHLISKKVDTERKLGRKGKNIDNTAAHSILPRFVHIIHILEPIATQHFRNKVHIHLFADMKLQGFISQLLTGYDFFRQRIRISNYTKPLFSLL